LPEDDKATFIYETLRDKDMLHIFGQYFFPNIIKGDYDTPEAHLDLIDEISNPNDSAIIFPRDHAKSTWIKIDTLHDIVYGLEPVILYVCATLTDAGFHFESIKGELENNIVLRAIYQDLVPLDGENGRKWTNKHFETTNEVNVVARGRSKGRGVNIKNQRPTKIIIDDVEDDEQVKNPKQRIKLHHWLYYVIFNSLDRERGKIKMVGTVLHEMAEVLVFYEKHGGIFRRAIENGKSIWEERWSLESLAEKKEKIGTRAFNREYMNDAKSDEEAKIKREWLERANFVVLPSNVNYKSIIYIDPQSGSTGLSDEYAITCLYCQVRTAQRFVVEQEAGRTGQIDQARNVVRMWQRHKDVTQAVGIEKVLSQTSTWSILLDWKAFRIDFNTPLTPEHERIDETNRNIPIMDWSPKGKDKVARLEMFEADFERGEIHLRPDMVELRNQLMFMGKDILDHDDRCLVAGTLVLTDKGQVPIEQIQKGMKVMTRQGYKSVIDSGCTGLKPVITRLGLTGTPDHPVMTRQGIEELQKMKQSATIYTWNEKQSLIEAVSITAIQIQQGVNYVSIFGRIQKIIVRPLRCIDNFGLTKRVKSLKAISSIIRMKIHLIIQWIIWTVFQEKNTQKNTEQMNGWHTRLRGLKKHSDTQKHGMEVKKDLSGINNMPKIQYTKRGYAFVYNAIKSLRHVMQNSVQPNAGSRVEPVYNLTIEGSHEFFANNVLVHNCDSLVGALEIAQTKGLGKKTALPTIVKNGYNKTITGNLYKRKF